MRYSSSDQRFQMCLSDEQLENLLRHCRNASGRETGGILVGHYLPTQDCAIVTSVSGPPKDSMANHTQFQRGVDGLKRWLVSLWAEPIRRYYLGEWHFHPFAAPTPSPTDHKQMNDIAKLPNYHCPEPILLIVGGDPNTKWSVSVHVYLRGGDCIPLALEQTNANGVIKSS